jgi:hypothetical protein
MPEADTAFTATPTPFDNRLHNAGQRLAKRLETSKKVGVLRASKVLAARQDRKQATPPARDDVDAEGEPIGDSGPVLGRTSRTPRTPSVTADSALDVFVDSTDTARRASPPPKSAR